MKQISMSIFLILFAISAHAQSRKVEHVQLKLEAANDEWSKTDLKIQSGDVLILTANGKVKIGSFIGEVGPSGDGSGKGQVQVKIGTATTLAAGEKLTIISDQSGPVKVRVSDTKYTDNSGAFSVNVILVPAELIPAAKEVMPE